MRLLNIVPVGAGVFDLLENGCIAAMLTICPAKIAIIAWLSTVCTMGKWIFLGVSVLLTLVGILKAAMNRFREQ